MREKLPAWALGPRAPICTSSSSVSPQAVISAQLSSSDMDSERWLRGVQGGMRAWIEKSTSGTESVDERGGGDPFSFKLPSAGAN
eukprot:5833410-Pyramimonas_sp.AAC.1